LFWTRRRGKTFDTAKISILGRIMKKCLSPVETPAGKICSSIKKKEICVK
jgi:hypothetical protein